MEMVKNLPPHLNDQFYVAILEEPHHRDDYEKQCGDFSKHVFYYDEEGAKQLVEWLRTNKEDTNVGGSPVLLLIHTSERIPTSLRNFRKDECQDKFEELSKRLHDELGKTGRPHLVIGVSGDPHHLVPEDIRKAAKGEPVTISRWDVQKALGSVLRSWSETRPKNAEDLAELLVKALSYPIDPVLKEYLSKCFSESSERGWFHALNNLNAIHTLLRFVNLTLTMDWSRKDQTHKNQTQVAIRKGNCVSLSSRKNQTHKNQTQESQDLKDLVQLVRDEDPYGPRATFPLDLQDEHKKSAFLFLTQDVGRRWVKLGPKVAPRDGYYLPPKSRGHRNPELVLLYLAHHLAWLVSSCALFTSNKSDLRELLHLARMVLVPSARLLHLAAHQPDNKLGADYAISVLRCLGVPEDTDRRKIRYVDEGREKEGRKKEGLEKALKDAARLLAEGR